LLLTKNYDSISFLTLAIVINVLALGNNAKVNIGAGTTKNIDDYARVSNNLW